MQCNGACRVAIILHYCHFNTHGAGHGTERAVVGWCREHTNMKTLFIFVIHIHNIAGDFVDLYQVSRNMSVVNFDGNVTLETLALSRQDE